MHDEVCCPANAQIADEEIVKEVEQLSSSDHFCPTFVPVSASTGNASDRGIDCKMLA